ncbi:DUF6252 family protein [Flavobacterium sp. W22_SRS_FP1]|uniref:DUF6252 family protein n=1 Tax=Flavobacterium sp. W22_SRS_FP1 TaxID=3240276 RepID=UPI003F90189A
MKKQILLIIVLFSLISCAEDVSFNNPSFQGVKDNVFWRAIESKASVGPGGALVIEAYSGNEVITLKTTSTTAQTYVLGTSTSKTATYVRTDSDGAITFTTGIDIGDGQIVIKEYDEVNHTVTGTFKFNAENVYSNPLAGSVLNFQQGVFYKVPVRQQVLTN